MKRYLITLMTFILFSLSSIAQEYTIMHDGLTRSYLLHLPGGYSADSLYPLVINMHGYTSNAYEQQMYSNFDIVADTCRFVVVYPNGIDEAWNVSSSTGVDDVGFISDLIDSLNAAYSIDLERVNATGMSMGGFMSYRLACELSNRIAAIAPVAGLLAFFPCDPPRPVPVLHIHGTNDQVVPYAGVNSSIMNWINNDGCPTEPVITEIPDINKTDNSTVTTYYYGPCLDSTEVILYSVIGGEHTWPGSHIYIGVTNRDIDASVEIWKFFRKFDIHGSTGVDDAILLKDIQIGLYPNPARNYMTVDLSVAMPGKYNFQLTDLAGNTIREINDIQDPRFVVNCKDLPAGMYIAVIQYNEYSTYKKVIIR
jgi:polyhydroxybutyrate depolymerase